MGDTMDELAAREREAKDGWDAAIRRRLIGVMVGIGIATMIVLLVVSVYYAVASGVLGEVIRDQFAAMFCVPIAYISSLILVLTLRVAAGPIEFRALGIEFRGASGPLVFWILCFLAIVVGFRVMWV